MASSLVFRQSHRLILLFALAATASLGSASLGLGGLGPAQAQSNDPATTINDGGRAYLTPSVLDGKQILRISVGAERTERAHVAALWEALQAAAT